MKKIMAFTLVLLFLQSLSIAQVTFQDATSQYYGNIKIIYETTYNKIYLEGYEDDETTEEIIDSIRAAEKESIDTTEMHDDSEDIWERVDRLRKQKSQKAAAEFIKTNDFAAYEIDLELEDSSVYHFDERGIMYQHMDYCPHYYTEEYEENRPFKTCLTSSIEFNDDLKALSFQSIYFFEEKPDTAFYKVVAYNEKNLPTIVEKQKNDGTVLETMKYFYNNNDKLTRIEVDGTEEFDGEISYNKLSVINELNEEGFVTFYQLVVESGMHDNVEFKYEYLEFDAKGNWTKMLTYSPYQDYPQVTYREIVYR